MDVGLALLMRVDGRRIAVTEEDAVAGKRRTPLALAASRVLSVTYVSRETTCLPPWYGLRARNSAARSTAVRLIRTRALRCTGTYLRNATDRLLAYVFDMSRSSSSVVNVTLDRTRSLDGQ